MNVEEIRDYCLSLGKDVEEKLPFVKFKNGEERWTNWHKNGQQLFC